MAEFHAYGGTHSVECLTAPLGTFTGKCPGPASQQHGYGLSGVALSVREKCVASPLYLASHVLCELWDANLLSKPSEAHRLVEKTMLAQRDLLYVDARGTAKTTLLDEVGTAWQFLKYPNDTQLITHSSIPNAKGITSSVRAHLLRNMVFRTLFPEYAMNDRAEEGNILSWSVPCRTRAGREESVEIAAAGTQTAGRHYDVVRCSDWMNSETTPLYGKASLETMKSLVESFSQVQGLLKGKEVNPRAHFTVDSNRWHDADLAGTIIRKDSKQDRVVKVVRGVTGTSGCFVSSWPEVKTPQMIQDIYDSPTMTHAMFAANYRSDPLPEGGVAFDRTWFKIFDREPKELDIAITVDPAFSDSKAQNKKSDRSAIIVSGFTPDLNLYVLEIRAGRWDSTAVLDNIFELMDLWKPSWVGIEETGSSRSIITTFHNECRKTGRYVHYKEIKPGGRSKEARIGPLHHIAKRWGIYVRPEHNELVEELVRFGVAEHDDLADALAYRAMDMYSGRAMALVSSEKPKSVPSGRDDTASGLLGRIEKKARDAELPAWRRARMTRVG